jgi:hypothetical protein
MDDAEAAAFMSQWEQQPDWTRDFELDARLRSGLLTLRQQGAIETAMRGPWWTLSLRSWTLAASVAAVSVAAWLWAATLRGAAPLLVQASELPVGESVALMRLRRATRADASIELTKSARAIELRLLPEVAPSTTAAKFALSIAPVEPRAWQVTTPVLTELPLGRDGFVRAYLETRALRPGLYILELRGGVATPVSEFVLEVRSASDAADAN